MHSLSNSLIEVTQPDLQRRYLEALLRENQHVNLTGIRDPQEAWVLHVLDSIAVAPHLRAAGARRVLDLGTGGGAPGVPVACELPEAHLTLVDATRKKVEAVARICAALELRNVEPLWSRAERLPQDVARRGAYDAVLARAVARLAQLIAWSAPLLRAGGQGWFYKSSAALGQELEQAQAAALRFKLSQVGVLRYTLPAAHGERVLIAYQKQA